MISIFQAVVLGVVQGITELFPISSLGHSVILPKLLHWKHMTPTADKYLTFLVATHLATALVLLGFFWRDWVRIVRGFVRSIARRRIGNDADARLAWLLIAGTIPAGIIGLALQKKLQHLFTSPLAAATFLILNGLLLFAAERLRRRAAHAEDASDAAADERLSHISVRQSVAVGLMQCLALIPGFSRAGAAMAGGLRVGLSNEDAARFAFLLATPIIGAAALLKLPHIAGHAGDGIRGACLAGAIAAAIAAWVSVKFLMRFFQSERLTPFAIYCVVAGVVFLAIVH